MSIKITLISFDNWNYDNHIVKSLIEKGINSNHIKFSLYKHKNVSERIKNTIYKILSIKNLKLIKRQDYIISELEKLGFQDVILVINPELIDKEYHLKIKKYTNKYIAYLYDSIARCPVENLLNNVFNEIYSFDKQDVEKYNLKFITNYIYFDKPKVNNLINQKFIYIGSIDNRLKFLNEFGNKLKSEKQSFVFYAIGKKAFVYKFKQLFFNKNKNIIFKKNSFNQDKTLKIYNESEIIVDLVRENQTGLSFRVFEAMGLQKNLITNNISISSFDFYEANKIKIIDNQLNFNTFEKSDYKLEIINKYHINNWVNTIFKLNI